MPVFKCVCVGQASGAYVHVCACVCVSLGLSVYIHIHSKNIGRSTNLELKGWNKTQENILKYEKHQI